MKFACSPLVLVGLLSALAWKWCWKYLWSLLYCGCGSYGIFHTTPDGPLHTPSCQPPHPLMPWQSSQAVCPGLQTSFCYTNVLCTCVFEIRLLFTGPYSFRTFAVLNDCNLQFNNLAGAYQLDYQLVSKPFSAGFAQSDLQKLISHVNQT